MSGKSGLPPGTSGKVCPPATLCASWWIFMTRRPRFQIEALIMGLPHGEGLSGQGPVPKDCGKKLLLLHSWLPRPP